jgi:hypothetical protein
MHCALLCQCVNLVRLDCRINPSCSAGVQVLRAVGTALAEGRVEDVKDAATLLLANSNLPGTTQQGRGRPIDLRPQLGLPPVVAGELDHTPVRLLSPGLLFLTYTMPMLMLVLGVQLGQSGFEAMLNWYLAAAEHQRGHYALSANHASQAHGAASRHPSLHLASASSHH